MEGASDVEEYGTVFGSVEFLDSGEGLAQATVDYPCLCAFTPVANWLEASAAVEPASIRALVLLLESTRYGYQRRRTIQTALRSLQDATLQVRQEGGGRVVREVNAHSETHCPTRSTPKSEVPRSQILICYTAFDLLVMLFHPGISLSLQILQIRMPLQSWQICWPSQNLHSPSP
jgi:hypothetical protein